MKIDVTALGELLIDFTQNGFSVQNNILFEANPGGAPCNVLAMLSRLGKKTAFIGKVGNDMFGNLLKDTIESVGIDSTGLVLDNNFGTTLAFVKTAEDGDRDFSFYRNPGADMMLNWDEVNAAQIQNSKIFHFGTLSMTHETIRATTKKVVETAKKAGCIISFDPNLRPPLWDSLENAKTQISYGCSMCDILKISDDELVFLTGSEDIESGVQWLKNNYKISLIFVTCGKKGAKAFYKNFSAEKPTYEKVKTIETTGAGDAFCGASLNYILEHGIDDLTKQDLEEILTFANAAASIVTTKKGAILSMPSDDEIRKLMANG